ncbi:MAG: molybdopterin-dependent oxidoreductase [Dehalococcoidia bacterium]|nr:molybdopterin-dependent oxidoreductase [Dehalococcoidia bacterium]
MADNTRSVNAAAGRRYVYGELINPGADEIAHERYSRQRQGITQIERVLRGEEVPRNVAAMRAALKAGGAPEPRRGPGFQLRVEPGFVVGHDTIDMRARDKVTGRAIYSADVYPPGVLYTKVLRSPFPHAKVTSIDVSRAEAHPGVHAVITYEDAPRSSRLALTGEPAFAGDPVAAVAAESEGIAEEAVNLIEVQYQELPFVLSPQDALRPGAPLVRSGLETNAARDPQFTYERGDAAQGFAEADLTVEVSVETSYEQHVAMEPHNAVAVWDDDYLTLYTSNQWPHGIANSVSGELEMPLSKVRVLAGDTGGGWGDKTGRHGYHIGAAGEKDRAARALRAEPQGHLRGGGAQLPAFRDGAARAQERRQHHGARGHLVRPVGRLRPALQQRRLGGGDPDVQEPERERERVQCHHEHCGHLAAAGGRGALRELLTENLANRAAEAVNLDPVEFRLRNIETELDQVDDLPYSSNGLRESIEHGAELFDWANRWQGWQRQRSLDGPQRGVGMMCFECNKGSASPPMTAIVQIQADDSVVVNTGAADIGGGQRTTWSMIVAETLGVPLDRVRIEAMDSHAGPDALGIFGSRGTKSVGTGMLHAAMDARAKLLQGSPPRGRRTSRTSTSARASFTASATPRTKSSR